MRTWTNKISEYFTWQEVIASDAAARFKLDNSVPVELQAEAVKTALKMDSVREVLGKPVLVSSWYRSPAVNRNVGGSKFSQHMKAQAVDFVCPDFGTPYEVCKELEKFKAELGIDQLIYEITWVHVSFADRPRGEVLTYRSGNYMKGVVK